MVPSLQTSTAVFFPGFKVLFEGCWFAAFDHSGDLSIKNIITNCTLLFVDLFFVGLRTLVQAG